MVNAAPYLSVARYRLAGLGVDLSNVNAVALRSTLRQATTMVNAFTNAAQLPQPFDFRGGTVTGEQHQFPLASPLVAYPGSRRVFIYQRPLRTVTAFNIQFTHNQAGNPGYEIDLNVNSDIFVNHTEGWCEIVASQPTIIGYPPIGYMFGTYVPMVYISYTYGYQNVVTDDVCEAGSPTLFYATYGSWDAIAEVEVQIDGSVVDPSTYRVNRADGSIAFTAAPTPNTEVTVSYTATLPDAIAQATGIIATDLLAKSRNMARMPGLSSMKVAEISLTRLTGDRGRYTTKNGISIPEDAAVLLGSFALGSAA